MAARAAARLRDAYPDARVETVSGKLMEMTVRVDGEAIYSTRHLVPSRPETIAEKVEAAIESKTDTPDDA